MKKYLLLLSFLGVLISTMIFSGCDSIFPPNVTPTPTSMPTPTATVPIETPAIGSWGDQGNGTYKNPVLYANYPDADIEKQGDTWYMISSTNNMAPGMTILESKDLVNWSLVTNIVGNLSWMPEYNYDSLAAPGNAGGVWAGDLAYHNNKWYCYFIDKNKGLFVCTADNIRGPWSEAKSLLENTGMTDPAVYWDEEEQQAYLVCHTSTINGVYENKIFKMAWDGMSLEDEDNAKVFYQGTRVEAIKVYKVNGYYYFFYAGTLNNDRKQFLIRSKSIYGPYEEPRILLEKSVSPATSPNRGACQGALVQTPDGKWWYMHQLMQDTTATNTSYEGRPQCLIPVTWENDWPVLGTDPDGNGIGNTVDQWQKPINGYPINAPQTDDSFDSSVLSPQWEWFYNPNNLFWSLTDRPGYLRLKAMRPLTENNFYKVPNVISQRKMGRGNDTITTEIDISQMKPLQQAGLAHRGGTAYNFRIAVEVDSNNVKKIITNFNNSSNVEIATIDSEKIWLRSSGKGNAFRFSYSVDGKDFIEAGDNFTLIKSGQYGHDAGRICLYSYSPTGEGYIDVAWFTYKYDGPKK